MIHTNDDNIKAVLSDLYCKHGYDMKRMAYGICKSSSVADDAVQQTFERLMRYPDSIMKCEPEKRKLLIFTVCKREVYRIYSREQRECDKLQKMLEKMSFTQSNQDDILQQYIYKESIDTVRKKIQDMPPEYSLPLILYEYSGLKLREIAQIMNLSISGVRKRLIKANEILAYFMQKELTI